MAHKKIKLFIDRLNQRMYQTYLAYMIRKYLRLSRDINTNGQKLAQKNVDVINEYINFFSQTELSNLTFFVIGIAKFFDYPEKNRNKPLSIKKARNYVQGNKKMLNADAFLKENNDRPFAKELAESYVGITEKDIKEIDMLLEKNKYIIEGFKDLRDKWAAHDDILKGNIQLPSFEKIEELFTDIVKMINILSYGLENSTTTYSHVEGNIQNDIFYMFKDLYKERPSNINTQKS